MKQKLSNIHCLVDKTIIMCENYLTPKGPQGPQGAFEGRKVQIGWDCSKEAHTNKKLSLLQKLVKKTWPKLKHPRSFRG
jgi:hypothetical protein